MPPTLTLADVDPEEVAAEVVRLVVDHLHQSAMRLDPTIVLPIPAQLDEVGGLGLRATARALAVYAQRGLPVWDWTDHGMAADGLLDVLATLYSRPADGDLSHTAIDVVDEVDPDDAVSLVLVAAAARIRIDRGEAVAARELGALAGLGAAGVRYHVREGELVASGSGRRGDPLRVEAVDAARWLAARGVAGFRESGGDE